jgi:hypothetical protein
LRSATEQGGQGTFVLRGQVLNEHQRDLRMGAESVEDLRERLEAARRCTDADDGNRPTARLLASPVVEVFFGRGDSSAASSAVLPAWRGCLGGGVLDLGFFCLDALASSRIASSCRGDHGAARPERA